MAEGKKLWEYMWWAKGVGEGAKTPRELAKALRESAEELEALSSALAPGEDIPFAAPVDNGYGFLVTDDEKIAQCFKLSRVDDAGHELVETSDTEV